MNMLVLMFIVILGSVLEAMLPTFVWLGYVPIPIMSAIVIYYALMHDRFMTIAAALLAGFMADSLSQMPLGYMSFCYCVAALIIFEIRETLLVRQWTIHALLGACVYVGLTLVLFVLLEKDQLIQMGFFLFLAKLFGAVVSGAITTPILFNVLERFERVVGVMEAREY